MSDANVSSGPGPYIAVTQDSRCAGAKLESESVTVTPNPGPLSHEPPAGPGDRAGAGEAATGTSLASG